MVLIGHPCRRRTASVEQQVFGYVEVGIGCSSRRSQEQFCVAKKKISNVNLGDPFALTQIPHLIDLNVSRWDYFQNYRPGTVTKLRTDDSYVLTNTKIINTSVGSGFHRTIGTVLVD